MPTRKVTVGAFTAGIVAIAIYCIKLFKGVEVPGDVAVAASGVLTFVMQYITPDAEA